MLKRNADALTAYFDRVLARSHGAPARLIESIRYSLQAPGKRLRPTLVLETFRACADERSAVSGEHSALAAAGAIELIHTFSLVHDDLPAMDNDDLRRGRPTNHKVFGEAMAILAGDAMVSMAFDLIAVDALGDLTAPLIRELAGATGPEGMIGGQVLDMEGENKSLSLPDLQALHRKKTGALLTAACRLGAISARADEATLAAITQFGRHLGLAFQIIDDLLDVTASPQQMGKATGKDAKKGKNTYPSLLGIDGARRAAQAELAAALTALDSLGAKAHTLTQLARFVVERQS
jgi:geranylgeranyl diphosphate synthase type II